MAIERTHVSLPSIPTTHTGLMAIFQDPGNPGLAGSPLILPLHTSCLTPSHHDRRRERSEGKVHSMRGNWCRVFVAASFLFIPGGYLLPQGPTLYTTLNSLNVRHVKATVSQCDYKRNWFVLETGGDDKQITKLTKELRSAAQKAKSELDFRPTSEKHYNSQRWSSTDEDYMPDRPRSRSAVHDDLDPRSRARRDSRSWADNHSVEYSQSRQQHQSRPEEGYGVRRSCAISYGGDDLPRTKTDLNRSYHRSSSRK